MIPKIIHYCWFGGNPIPEKDKKCIESWKKFCPDYEIICWNESNYNLNKNQYMKEAYQAKKWGFVPDYARLDIIYNHGGIYLDSDVEMIKNFDDFLNNKAFMGFESGKHISPGLCIGAEKGHQTICELMDIYKDLKFLNIDGTYNTTPSPVMNTEYFLLNGLIQNNEKQIVNDVTIYPTEYFSPKNYSDGKLHITNNTYSIHHFNASWQTPKQKFMHKVKGIIGANNFNNLVNIKNKILKKGV